MTDSESHSQPTDITLSQHIHTLGKGAVRVIMDFSLSLGTIFFIPSAKIALILWLALLQSPRYTVFAIAGVIVGASVAKALKITDTPTLGGGLKANALLTAVMVAWLTSPSDIPFTTALIIASTAATAAAILAAALTRLLRKANLPPLIWGYCLVAAMLLSLCPECTLLTSKSALIISTPESAIDWIGTFVRSLGSLIYLPNYGAGLLVGLSILLWSRLLFLTGLIAWISGACTAILLGRLGVHYAWLAASYNYFIVGMALGSVYFLPGRSSLLIAVAGGCGAAFFGIVLQQLFEGSSSANLPIIAATTIWIAISAVTIARHRSVAWSNLFPQLQPEEAWWRSSYWAQRFGHNEVLLSTPISGELVVSQGFNGLLSHTGKWRHALDFQRPDTFESNSDPTTNIWDAAVYAPASGTIERIVNSIPDNLLGISNYADNWGNYVVIRLDQGNWAVLAHFQQGSIAHSTGTHLEAGEYLGKVGNSGRSPIPHLHLQAQCSAEPGAPTIPFRLVNFYSPPSLSHWYAAACPSEDDIITAAYSNQFAHTLLASIMPGSSVWAIESQGNVPRNFRPPQSNNIIRVHTALNEAGQHLFYTDRDKGKLLACLAPDAWRIIEGSHLHHPFLQLFALAAPSIPYAVRAGVTWQDPAPIMATGPINWLSKSVAPYLEKHFIYSSCKCVQEPNAKSKSLKIETTIDSKQGNLPIKLLCEFQILRGPVKILAEFKTGSVTYSLLSFEQKQPQVSNRPE